MRIFKNLRRFVKFMGLVDALLDEFEVETTFRQAQKLRSREKVSEIYKEVSNLVGKDRNKN